MRYPRNRFVVQEHFSSHHHYDFRLEMDGTLKSWPFQKKSLGRRKLGVSRAGCGSRCELHRVRGEIAEGDYGAGIVRIYDSGDYYLLEKKEEKIKVVLLGKKLEGVYELIRLKDQKNWLIFMVGDRAHVIS